MKTIPRILISLSLAISLPLFAQNISVNGKTIPSSQVNQLVKEAEAQGQKDTPELRKEIKEALIMRELLLQEAQKQKIQNTPVFKAQLENARQNILVHTLRYEFLRKNPISDADVKKIYDQMKAQAGNTEYDVAHVLLKSKEDAKVVIEQLNSDSSFERFQAIAKEKSIDGATAQRGGQLGWSVPSTYMDSFAQAMTKLKPGEYTKEAVQTPFGYHVIMVKETRDYKFPDFNVVKPGLLQRMQEQQWIYFTNNLRQKAVIK